ncbi:MAG: alcohol dehydrogenase catalytic domain-containing protein [Deltaproteobacteria bacterium]|nr:alcohol dehydrogenase catalytic domain-containing protein [Deltaproteobacteria bacterium]
MRTTMKALKIEGKKRLSVVEVPIPEADGEKVIIKVKTSGICGSDIHIWEKGKPEGLIPGHEFGGTVVDSGSRDDLNPGDRVTVIPLNPCGECSWCRNSGYHTCKYSLKRGIPGVTAPGSYAEYFSARPDMVRKLPDTVSDVEAAVVEPATVALHAVNLANIKAGDKVLIVGGGVIGLLCAVWARIYGASFLGMSETNESRGAKALAFGDIHAMFNAKDPELTSTLKKTAKGLFDKAIDCSGSAGGINAAIDVLNHQGTLLLVGISYAPIPVMTLPVCRKEMRLIGDMGYSIPEFEHTMEMMSRGMIDTKRFVDDKIDLDEVQGAFERLSSGNAPEVKILIEPHRGYFPLESAHNVPSEA